MSTPQPDRSPLEELRNEYASRRIDQTEYSYPEIRTELVDGKFLMGGMIEGTRWFLQEAFIGWGLEAAIGFAPLEAWWSALRIAYQVDHQTPEEWLLWAESLPIEDHRNFGWPPLGSRYGGEHRWFRERLYYTLSTAVSVASLGSSFGPHYGMWIGDQVFTPDLVVVFDVRLAENPCHDRYLRGPASLVIEMMMPEWPELDEQVRRQYYEQAGVPHYWIINPLTQTTQFWELTDQGYEARSLDADGSYRGIPNLTFTPALLWVETGQPYPRLPIFTSERRSRQWQLTETESPEPTGWDSVPFTPVVELEPVAIRPDQFVAWCPRSKLEGGPFPLLGGYTGTRNAIAMALMSLGLVEAVKLMPGYEWVRLLRRLGREQAKDAQIRERWWAAAREMADRLHHEHQVGGVGVVGDLLQPQPLHYWSELKLMLWEVPDEVSPRSVETPDDIAIDLIEVKWAHPSDWQAMQHMTVLVGEWHGQEHPRLQRRLQFHWVEDERES